MLWLSIDIVRSQPTLKQIFFENDDVQFAGPLNIHFTDSLILQYHPEFNKPAVNTDVSFVNNKPTLSLHR